MNGHEVAAQKVTTAPLAAQSADKSLWERVLPDCAVCGRFVSNIRLISSELAGMLAVIGDCKQHGEQCLDIGNWQFEHFES